MKNKHLLLPFIAIWAVIPTTLWANLIPAIPATYTSLLDGLEAGDTLLLAPGIYTKNLTLNNRNGTLDEPIVIMGNGNSTIFQGQSCCNTVSLTKCSNLVLKQFQLDGLNQSVDAIKAEGTSDNWAHHITIEYLRIKNYGASQQNVGISTKCTSWNWVVRKNIIEGVGTGMYFGNSDGTKPFVNGIIEYNLIANTIGYNIEVKHQLDNVRDEFSGTAVNGKTIIRHNVFTKDETSSTGGNARPNLLVGGFPLSGWGSEDYYEIYGNFFYNNPAEALFQGTGNIHIYNNIFVNHFETPGSRALYIAPHNGVSPQNIQVFHNTIWAMNSSGGIRLYNPNAAYQQVCYGNAVFSPNPISNFSNESDNITDSYANAGNYFLSASADISVLNLVPQSGTLSGLATPTDLFEEHTDWDIDFNGSTYDWTSRGAYTGCCINMGWTLKLDTMPTLIPVTIGITTNVAPISFQIYPNPCTSTIRMVIDSPIPAKLVLYDLIGHIVHSEKVNSSELSLNIEGHPSGIYFLKITTGFQEQTATIYIQ
ncbi:MAG: T9SS type A sorting domain-containing protein [Saprospiraceae bacterium]|nr:T9SS type A sorting domain-containing protein [Saprospiraceae bacterium]